MSQKTKPRKLTVLAIPEKTHKRFKDVVDSLGMKMGSAATEAAEDWIAKRLQATAVNS